MVNIGDLLMRWTNDRWLSNLHRVVNPPLDDARPRLSIAFFNHPNYDALLVRQSEEYAAAWQRHGLPGRYLPLPEHDHFSILEELAQPAGALLAALKELAART